MLYFGKGVCPKLTSFMFFVLSWRLSSFSALGIAHAISGSALFAAQAILDSLSSHRRFPVSNTGPVKKLFDEHAEFRAPT